MTVKGIRTAVQLYEVPWQIPGMAALDDEFAADVPNHDIPPASPVSHS
jgi:hypothetical protein